MTLCDCLARRTASHARSTFLPLSVEPARHGMNGANAAQNAAAKRVADAVFGQSGLQVVEQRIMDVQQWSDRFAGVPSEATLRERFPPGAFRVSRSLYAPHDRFPGVMTAGTCYVLQGACRYAFAGEVVTVRAGEFCELPGGDYEFEVVDPMGAEEVLVWDLRAALARAGVPWSAVDGPGAG